MVAGHREQQRRVVLPLRYGLDQSLQQRVDLRVLVRLAGEGEIPGEQDQIPRAALAVQLRQPLEEELLCLRPEPLLSALPRVEIGDVQPAKVHCS